MTPKRLLGTIRLLRKEHAYAFISGGDGVEYFFHRSATTPDLWDQLQLGVTVRFLPTLSKKGPRAEDVERVEV